MKKIFAILLLLSFVILSGCSSKGNNNSPSDINDISSNEEISSNKVESSNNGITINELFGYSFAFDYSITDDGLISGYVGRGENYDILITEKDFYEFSSWESIVKDFEKELSDSLYTAFQYRISELPNENYHGELFKNKNGIDIYKVEGTAVSYSNGERDFKAYYYVTDDNYIRCFATLMVEGFEDEIKDSMDYMAENLKKAE